MWDLWICQGSLRGHEQPEQPRIRDSLQKPDLVWSAHWRKSLEGPLLLHLAMQGVWSHLGSREGHLEEKLDLKKKPMGTDQSPRGFSPSPNLMAQATFRRNWCFLTELHPCSPGLGEAEGGGRWELEVPAPTRWASTPVCHPRIAPALRPSRLIQSDARICREGILGIVVPYWTPRRGRTPSYLPYIMDLHAVSKAAGRTKLDSASDIHSPAEFKATQVPHHPG